MMDGISSASILLVSQTPIGRSHKLGEAATWRILWTNVARPSSRTTIAQGCQILDQSECDNETRDIGCYSSNGWWLRYGLWLSQVRSRCAASTLLPTRCVMNPPTTSTPTSRLHLRSYPPSQESRKHRMLKRSVRHS